MFFAPLLFVLEALKCQTDHTTQTEAYLQWVADEKGLVLRSASEQENRVAERQTPCRVLQQTAAAVSVPGLGSEAR